MSKELVISSNRHETKVAILEDDQLVEIYFQRANEYSLAGSIHKGRVTRVLPGMQSAFVDLGLERDTFLYVSDFFDENGEEYDKIVTTADEKANHRLSVREPRADRTEPRGESGRQHRPPAPVAAAPPAVEEEPAPAAEAPAAAPIAERQPDEGDPRDRRGGRRSRRRRTRGRGFPESKYASDVSPVGAPQPEPADDSEPEGDVILLPGESLAKYRNRAAGGNEAESHGDAANLAEAAAAFEPVADDIEDEPEGDSAPIEPASADAVATAFPDPSYLAPPISSVGVSEEAKEPHTQAVREAVESFIRESDTPDVSELADEETAPADTEPAETAIVVDLEDLGDELGTASDDIQTTIGGEDADEEVQQEPGETDIESIIADADLDEAGSPAEPAMASVREQHANRFQHRGSRRMRRRRSGDRERAVEAPVVPPPEVVVDKQAGRDKSALPSITDLLREGQEIIVQIAKEPLGQKGARITSHIALPGRYVVYMPTLEHLGVSRKISSDEERQRLKRILQTHRAGLTGGFIVRTAGEGHSDDEIGNDMSYLYNLWLDIRQKAEKKPAPVLLHHDLDIVQRILRDQLSDMFKAIWVDSEEIYESVVRFMQRFQPALVGRVKLYTRQIPIFEAFNVAQEIEKALRPKVWLKSGGYIVINQTEALVAVDVNTGKYVGKSNRLEDTITKTNTEAVKEIVRQIRLRDLGGIIVVDFIDMDERKNRQKVMQALEEAMRADRAPYKILQFNDFGLVAITRKRVKQSLERTLCAPCPTCEGAAYVKNVQTVVGEILQEAGKLSSIVEGKNVILRAHPDVAKHLKSSRNSYLEEIEEVLGRPVLVTSDPALHPDKFDLAW
jgi:ribonuclease G